MRHKLKYYKITFYNGCTGLVNGYSIKDVIKTERHFFGNTEDIKNIKRCKEGE